MDKDAIQKGKVQKDAIDQEDPDPAKKMSANQNSGTSVEDVLSALEKIILEEK